MLADLAATALLALGSHATVLAHLAAAAFIACVLKSPVLAEASSAAFSALRLRSIVLTSENTTIPDSNLPTEFVLLSRDSIRLGFW